MLDTGISDDDTLLNDYGTQDPRTERFIDALLLYDVNNDNISDVIAVLRGVRVGEKRDTGLDPNRQVWIYYGGEDFS